MATSTATLPQTQPAPKSIGSYQGVPIYGGSDAEVQAQVQKIDASRAAAPAPAPAPAPTTTKVATPSTATQTNSESELQTVQKQLTTAQRDDERAYQTFAKTINSLQNGSMPLSAGENAQIEALKQNYAGLIQEQQLMNRDATGTAQIRGYQIGAAEYDPTFNTKVIGSIMQAGAAKIMQLQTAQAKEIAGLTQAFKDRKLSLAREKYEAYQEVSRRRQEELQRTVEATQKAIKTAQDEKRLYDISQSIATLTTEGVTKPAAVIQRLKEMGIDATAEEVDKSLKIINPTADMAGLSADYRTYVALKEAGDSSVKGLNWLQYQKAVTNATTKVTGGGGGGGGDIGSASPITQAVISNPSLFDDLTPTVRGQVIAELQALGYNTTNLGTKPLSDTAIQHVAQTQSAISGLHDLKAELDGNLEYLGPLAGYQALNPYSPARQIQSKIDKVRQTVGKALEGGVLRKEDEDKYKKILATLTDTPDTAMYKIDALITSLQRDIETYKELQSAGGRTYDVMAPLVIKGQEVPVEDLRTKYAY